MTFPVLIFALAVPRPMTPLVGKLTPAGPRLLLAIVLLLFAPPVDVLNRMLPVAVVLEPVEDPSTEQFAIVSLDAPLIRRMVLVPAVAETVVFEIVNELPPCLAHRS